MNFLIAMVVVHGIVGVADVTESTAPVREQSVDVQQHASPPTATPQHVRTLVAPTPVVHRRVEEIRAQAAAHPLDARRAAPDRREVPRRWRASLRLPDDDPDEP